MLILDPTVTMPRGSMESNRPLSAKSAAYEPQTEQHPSGYRLSEMIEPRDLQNRPSVKLATEGANAGENSSTTILITPLDAPWLKEDECFVVTNLSFDMIAFPDSWKQFSSTFDLIREVNNPGADIPNSVLTSVHTRFAQPVLDCVLLVLGIPLILRGANKNIFIAIGLSIVVIVGFMLVVTIGQSLSANYLINPLLGAWLPLFMFVPIAAYVSEPLWE